MLLPRPTDACANVAQMQNAKCKMRDVRVQSVGDDILGVPRECDAYANAKCKMQNAECKMQNARCKGAIRRGRHPCESCEVYLRRLTNKKCLMLIMPMIIYEKRERKAKGAFVPVSYSRRESKKITF